jgi:hypothetical protein
VREDGVVASPDRHDWFRSPVWDEQIEAAFERASAINNRVAHAPA